MVCSGSMTAMTSTNHRLAFIHKTALNQLNLKSAFLQKLGLNLILMTQFCGFAQNAVADSIDQSKKDQAYIPSGLDNVASDISSVLSNHTNLHKNNKKKKQDNDLADSSSNNNDPTSSKNSQSSTAAFGNELLVNSCTAATYEPFLFATYQGTTPGAMPAEARTDAGAVSPVTLPSDTAYSVVTKNCAEVITPQSGYTITGQLTFECYNGSWNLTGSTCSSAPTAPPPATAGGTQLAQGNH
ncbi:MAG: hypothetical protein C5B49_00630 [Bdellovibrio sp.]|nr:MAG: hypothetical protein C5B49_00630 [Bdellovibrio sp.]